MKIHKRPKIDSKTMLQEFSLKKYKVLPKYTLLKTKGPKHKPVFHVQVKIKSSKSIDGIGSSKKLAEQDAATSLLRKMNLLWFGTIKDFYYPNLNIVKIQ